ncbi:MAG: phosphoglycerate kinase [Candidatus Aenigmarchaeota archaeon]|nr:phosphoglycerate kinase [Candidatus Aenigmarchaeota archaeon]
MERDMDMPKNNIVKLNNSIVFLRVDMNSPIDKSTGKLLDEHRIMDGVNAIKMCLKNGADIVIIISHQGRKKEDTLKLHLSVIQKYFQNRVKFISNILYLPKAAKDAKAGDILLVENIRSLDEEKNYTDVTNTALYKTFKEVEKITNKNIVYVKDDLSVCHRKDLSVYGLPMQLKAEGYEVIAGQLTKNELIRVKISKEKMGKSNVICLWGGGKFEDYLHLFEPFLTAFKNSIVLTAGPLALLMLKAKGENIGENETIFDINGNVVKRATEIIKKFNDRVITPKDFYVENSNGKELVSPNNLNGLIVDIGPKTVKFYKNILSKNPSSTIIGNGPLGEYEKLPNAKGTIQVYTEVFNPLNKHFVIGGGGDFNTMMDILGFKPNMRSSGGKAFLELLVFGTLPGLEPLGLSVA